MVLALLLSDPNKPLLYRDLDRVVLQCLHGVHVMWKALSILDSATLRKEPETHQGMPFPSPFQSLSAFDAHVGDCSCQLRAQMLWELVQHYSSSERNDALKCAIAMLLEIKAQAALLLREIELNYGRPRSPELDALKTHLSVWQRIGFTRFLNAFYESSGSPSGTGVPQTATAAAGDEPKPTQSSHKHRKIAVEAEWDVDKLFLVARFLTFSLLLSEFKVAEFKPGPPIRVVVRVDLGTMYAEIERELEALGLLPERRRIKCHDGKVKMNAQRDAMQTYVSIATTDWIGKATLGLGLHDFHRSLSEGLIAASCRRISCVSQYASMVTIRAAWLALDTPLMLVIQRICSDGGFHNVYCRVTKNPAKPMSSVLSPHEMGECDWFDVTLFSAEDIMTSSWAGLPHVVMICMSGEGTIDDFRQTALEINQGKPYPDQSHGGSCQEIADYISKVQQVNFASLITYCFADDDQFPFSLPNGEDRIDRVSRLLQSGLGKGAKEIFEEARNGANEFGTGRSTDMFTIEHVICELPGVVIGELKGKPTVYGCKVEV